MTKAMDAPDVASQLAAATPKLHGHSPLGRFWNQSRFTLDSHSAGRRNNKWQTTRDCPTRRLRITSSAAAPAVLYLA
jgi:hypothetical protein